MGSVGAQRNVNSSPYLGMSVEPSNVVNLFSTGPQEQRGWDYRGISQTIDRLENTLNSTHSSNTIARVYSALKRQEAVINSAMEVRDGDRNVLLTQRRRIRQLLRRITSEK